MTDLFVKTCYCVPSLSYRDWQSFITQTMPNTQLCSLIIDIVFSLLLLLLLLFLIIVCLILYYLQNVV